MFSKTRQTDHFGILSELLSTQNVNIARFVRNVKWDFSRDFQTPCCYRNLNPRENSLKSNLKIVLIFFFLQIVAIRLRMIVPPGLWQPQDPLHRLSICLPHVRVHPRRMEDMVQEVQEQAMPRQPQGTHCPSLRRNASFFLPDLPDREDLIKALTLAWISPAK